MPITPAQLDAQVGIEREQISMGLTRLRDMTRKMEDMAYASATVYGNASINHLLPLLRDEIIATLDRIHERKNGVDFAEVHAFLEPLEPLAAAAITLKVTIDRVCSTRPRANAIGAVIDAIGSSIEQECQMRHYETTAPGLLRSIKERYWHHAMGTSQRFVVTRTMFRRMDDIEQWTTWGVKIRAKLGAWLLECLMKASGWFDKSTVREGKKTSIYVIPTAVFLEQKATIMADAELFSPLMWPMLIPPRDWSNTESGGYLLNELMRGNPLVRGSNPSPIQEETPIKFLNRIQQVAYRLNPFTLGVAEVLMARGHSVGKFVPIVEVPLPSKPFDIADNYDSRLDYRRRCAETMNTNANAFRRSCRTRMTMQAAARFKDVERFYLPFSFDYRGRVYPIPAFLTPMDTDFGKSLIRFADESFVTPASHDWLAFQLATTYGLDKSSIEERLAWVHDNQPLIARVATDPLSYIGDWEGAAEPWQFLAACDEYYQCVVTKTRTHTGLAVAIDATCSGLQILAGLARDRSTAALVNVLPGERPNDAYRVVAEAAGPHVPDTIRPYMDRTVTKRVVMTIPYNAKPYSNRSYIREALREKGVDITKEDLTITVSAVRDAMNRIVPGPMAVMAWIEKEVGRALARGVTHFEWQTPSGFNVRQRLMKRKTERLDLQLLGRCQVSIGNGYTNDVDKAHHKNATSPNLIHSLDASLLHLAALEFSEPLALIHDSVLCRATDMTNLSTVVRSTYMHLFAEHDYLLTFARMIGAETEPPIIGDLNPESVIESTYFFC